MRFSEQPMSAVWAEAQTWPEDERPAFWGMVGDFAGIELAQDAAHPLRARLRGAAQRVATVSRPRR